MNKCSIQAQDMYKRLLCLVDDYGCCEANIEIIKGRAYSMTKGVGIKSIKKWRDELIENDLIRIWNNREREFLIFSSAEKNLFSGTSYTNEGKPTRHRRKTPEPPENLIKSQPLPDFANKSQVKPNPNPNPKHNLNHKYIVEIISYLNLKAKKNFRPDSKIAVKNITARLNEKYTIDDFKKVIDIKCSHWLEQKKGEPDMSIYLSPDTLFGNKFEKYLNQNANKEAIQEAKIKEKEWESKKEKRDNYKHTNRPEKITKEVYGILAKMSPKYKDKLNKLREDK